MNGYKWAGCIRESIYYTGRHYGLVLFSLVYSKENRDRELYLNCCVNTSNIYILLYGIRLVYVDCKGETDNVIWNKRIFGSAYWPMNDMTNVYFISMLSPYKECIIKSHISVTHRRTFILLDGSREVHLLHFHKNIYTQIPEILCSGINSLNSLLSFSQQLLLTPIYQHQFYYANKKNSSQ